MLPPYDYRNCQSLFGYAQRVYERCQAVCQLCGCDASQPLNFELWRQMTVEHLVGESQGGYLRELRTTITQKFPGLPAPERGRLAERLDEANTVTACSFCNSMTSHERHSKDMYQLVLEAEGTPDEVVAAVNGELRKILERKRAKVRWKLESVRQACDRLVAPKLTP